MMPTFWQMYHGEPKAGLTVHYMSEKVDEGAALLQEDLNIEPGETLDDLIRRSKRHAAHCLARVLRSIASNTATTLPLNREKGSYFTFPTFAEIREFHRRGLRAI
jgi:methionyl-tRNA formyltransferase